MRLEKKQKELPVLPVGGTYASDDHNKGNAGFGW